MKKKAGIIGGSGLYNIEGLENQKWKTNSSWGDPQIVFYAQLTTEKRSSFCLDIQEVIK